MQRVNYAKLINLARLQGMNVKDLAEKAELSRATIYDLKKMGKDVRSGTIQKLASAVHVTPDELLLDFDKLTPKAKKLASGELKPTEDEAVRILTALDPQNVKFSQLIDSLRAHAIAIQTDLDSFEASQLSVSHRGVGPDDQPEHEKLNAFIGALSESEAKRALDILKLTFDVGHGVKDTPESE